MAGNLLCSPDTLFRHICLVFGERLDTLFTSSDSKISGFTRPHVIGFVADLFFFHFGERIYIFLDSLSNSPDACGR